MIILLVGATGLLGRKLMTTYSKKYTLIGTAHKTSNLYPNLIPLDISHNKQVTHIFKRYKPDVVIHAASIGDVDYCEKYQKRAWEVNVIGTENLLKEAAECKAKFIFLSTNAVFSGKKAPYSENDRVHPLNFYGKTKVKAEKIVHSYKNHSIIFRLNTMYGWNDPHERFNPAAWIIKRLSQRQTTSVVTDVFNNHLWVGQAADCVWMGIKNKLYGELFHIAGGSCISRFEFCQIIADVFKLDKKRIVPVTSNYFSTISPRAKNTCFDTQKMENVLNIKPMDIYDGLTRMKNDR